MPRLRPFPTLFVGLIIGLLILITSQFLISMKHIQSMHHSEKSASKVHVALLLEGPTYDQGWNSSALESLTDLQKRYGFSLEIVNNMKSEEIADVATKYASNGYDLILGHGLAFSEPFTKVAVFYPQTRFVSFNGDAPHENTTTIRYDMRPSGYLVGYLTAKMTKSGNVGYIVVNKPTELAQLEGFREGVKKVSPSIVVSVGYVPTFNDIETAVQATRSMIAQGVDVIYTTGDSFNLEVITEAQRSKVYTIGYIADQRYIAPDYVLTSLVQDVRECYRTIIDQFIKGKLPHGKVTYGLAEGVNRFSPFGPMVPQEIQDEINQELKKLLQ
jgi:transcriptional activator of comK gene